MSGQLGKDQIESCTDFVTKCLGKNLKLSGAVVRSRTSSKNSE